MKVTKVESRNKARAVRAKKAADGGKPEKKPRAKRKTKAVHGEVALAENNIARIEPRADAYPNGYQKSGIDLVGILLIVSLVTLGALTFLGVF